MSNQKVSEKIDYRKGNPSGLAPVGRAILVIPDKVQKGLIQLPPGVSDRQMMIEDRVTVVAIGPHCWHDEPTPRAEVGDRVMVAKFSGYMVQGPADGQMYRVINDQDIYVKLTDNSEK